MTGTGLHIGGGLVAAWRFLPRAWRAAWAALTLTMVAVALAFAAAPAWWFVVVLVVLMARGALWRVALGGGRPGPGGLQLGAMEGRIASAWALSTLFMAILTSLMIVVLLCCAYAAASVGRGFDPAEVATWASAVEGGGRVFLGAAAFVCVAGMVFAATRVSLAEAATVTRAKVQVLSAWTLSRGRVVFLLIANVIVAGPALALLALRMRGHVGWTWAVAEGVAVGGLWLPLSIGLMAYAYETAET